jgi:hypothetical protein
MPTRGDALALFPAETNLSLRGLRMTLHPVLPDGDPLDWHKLELNDEPKKGEPTKSPPSLPDYPTDVPAPQPHDVPAWEPVDDPPPDPGEPQPKPRPIP